MVKILNHIQAKIDKANLSFNLSVFVKTLVVKTTVRRRQLQYLMVRALEDCDVRSLIMLNHLLWI